MSEPNVLDFSAPEEEVVTIVFPDKKTCELPTMDELTMPAFQFVSANGEEWYRLFEKSDQTQAERKRFGHLNNELCYVLCEAVPRKTVDLLSDRQKARILIGFMTASSGMRTMIADLVEAEKKSMPAK